MIHRDTTFSSQTRPVPEHGIMSLTTVPVLPADLVLPDFIAGTGISERRVSIVFFEAIESLFRILLKHQDGTLKLIGQPANLAICKNLHRKSK